MIQTLHFFTALLLLLVTGVFWGPWFALSRSMRVFTAVEFIRIAHTMAANLGTPMRWMMPACLLLLSLSAGFYPHKDTVGFCFSLLALLLNFAALLVTLLVEVPIVNRMRTWTTDTWPADWEQVRDRWIRFHVVRTFASIFSFAAFMASLLYMY